MDTTTKLVTIAACAVSLIFSAGLLINAPPYLGTQLENGLVVRIHFDKLTYQTLDTVIATYEFYNPLKNSVSFTPPRRLSIESGYVGERVRRNAGDVYPPPESVTLGPGEAFSINASHDVVLKSGTFIVDVNGTLGIVEVSNGPLEARVSTDRDARALDFYVLGQGGTAALEVFNSGSAPLRYENFSPLELRYWYVGESPGFLREGVYVSYWDLYTTVQPGESHRVWSFSFDTPKAGTLILDFNGARRTVEVIQSR